MTTAELVAALVALPAVIGNLAFWWWVVRHGDDRARRWAEGRFGVTIERGPRGHWRVRGASSWLAGLGIELLQLLFFLGAFVVWAAALLAVVLVQQAIAG